MSTARQELLDQDKKEFERVDAYCNLCLKECEIARREQRRKVTPEHIAMWNYDFPYSQFKTKVYALKATATLHLAHIFLSNIYRYDVTFPPNDPRHGQLKEDVDVRPYKWLKDLADEEHLLKALELNADVKQYKV